MENVEPAKNAPAETVVPATTTVTSGEKPASAESTVVPATTEKKEPVVPGSEVTTKEPTPAEKRIAKLVAQREEEKRNAEYWRGVAEGRKEVKPDTSVAEVVPEAPKVEDFPVYDDYLVAKAKFELRQELKEERERERVRDEKNREKTTDQEAHGKFMERMEAASETDPDLLEEYKDPTLPISPAMASVIRDSDHAPKLVRYLIDNRKDSARIAKLTPLAAARELGKIEAKVSATPTKTEPPPKVSLAPEPITPINSEGKGVVELEELSIDEFMKRRNTQQFGKRG